MPQPNWHMKHWTTGKPLTLTQAFGFGSFKLTYPSLKPALPSASGQAQRPLQVQGTVSPQQGKNPLNAPKAQGNLQKYAKKLLVQHGWTGAAQWQAFNNLVNAESGWNPRAVENQSINGNPPTFAFGIAQAFGHGLGNKTQGSLSNMYGGYGLSNQQAKEANSGNGYMQLTWMMNYIEQSYGSPVNAWSYHQANNSY